MTTEVIKTIRASGGDYTTLSAWEAALPASLVAVDQQHTAVCYNDWPSGLADAVTISGVTTDATRYITVTVAEGNRHNGTPKTGFNTRVDPGSNTAYAFTVSVGYTRLVAIDVENSRPGSAAGAIYSDATSVVADRCIAKCAPGRAFAGNFGTNYAATRFTLQNCLAWESNQGFARTDTVRSRYNAYNCTAAGCVTGFSSGSTNKAALKNCVAYGSTTIGFEAQVDATNSSHNASSDTSATVFANYLTGITSAEFVDAANNDFHLAAGSALIGAGTNLYSTFTMDIDGDARPSSGAWDIGFDHYVAGGFSVSVSDSGSGADILSSIAVTLGLTDSGTGVDTAPGATASLAVSDTGAGTDALTLAALLALADAGTGADALTLAVAVQLADSGTGADLVNLLTATLISLADSGTGADAIAAVTVALGLADTGAGTDATVIQAALQLADAGSGVDALSVLTATLIQILDAGAGTDGLSIAVAVPMSDAGLGTDLLAIQAFIALVESATGADAVLRFDAAARIYSITFSVATRHAQFILTRRQAAFSLRRREATFLLN